MLSYFVEFSQKIKKTIGRTNTQNVLPFRDIKETVGKIIHPSLLRTLSTMLDQADCKTIIIY